MALPAKPRFYRHSGKVPAPAFLLAPPLCLLVGLLTGGIYGYLGLLVHLVPLAEFFLLFLICALMALGALLGIFPAMLMSRLHARSTPAVLVLTLIESLAALYSAWFFWFVSYFQYFGRPFPLRLASPLQLARFIQFLSTKGVWTSFSVHPAGPALWAIWIGEAAVIIGIALFIAARAARNRVYCESCKKWGSTRSLMQTRPIKSELLRKNLFAGNFESLASAEKSPDGDSAWNQFTLEGCPSCDNLQTLTVERARLERDRRRTKTKTTHIIHRLLLTPDQTVTLAHIAASVMTGELPADSPTPTDAPSPSPPA